MMITGYKSATIARPIYGRAQHIFQSVALLQRDKGGRKKLTTFACDDAWTLARVTLRHEKTIR